MTYQTKTIVVLDPEKDADLYRDIKNGIQFCGKHRRFVTEHTLAKDLYQKCKDYEEVKK